MRIGKGKRANKKGERKVKTTERSGEKCDTTKTAGAQRQALLQPRILHVNSCSYAHQPIQLHIKLWTINRA